MSKFLYRNIFRNMLLFSGTFGCLQESIALVVKIFERICWNFVVMLLPRPRSYCPYSMFRHRCACADIHGIKGVKVLLLLFLLLLLLLFSFLFMLLLLLLVVVLIIVCFCFSHCCCCCCCCCYCCCCHHPLCCF